MRFSISLSPSRDRIGLCGTGLVQGNHTIMHSPIFLRKTGRTEKKKKRKTKNPRVVSTCSLSFIKDSNCTRPTCRWHRAKCERCDRISPSASIFHRKAQECPPVRQNVARHNATGELKMCQWERENTETNTNIKKRS